MQKFFKLSFNCRNIKNIHYFLSYIYISILTITKECKKCLNMFTVSRCTTLVHLMIIELDIPHLNVAHMLKIIHHAGFVLPESKTQIRVMSSFAITLSYPENQRNLLAAN